MEGKLNFLNNFLRKAGFELRKYNPRNSEDFQLRRILEKNKIDVVLDIGANDGGYAKSLRSLGYEGKIISFEPVSVAHEKLAEESKDDSNWKVAPRMAIGDYNGKTEINVSQNLYSSSILNIKDTHVSSAPQSGYVDKEVVDVYMLDSLVGDILPQNLENAFLKVDVQGYEKQVLDGAGELLENIQGIQSEMSLVPLYEDQILYDEFISIMQGYNFTIHAIFPGFMNKKMGQLLQFDGVFIKDN